RYAVFIAPDRDRSVFDALIGPADADAGRVDHLAVEMLHDRASETVVQHVVFDGADNLHAAREEFERAGVERLDPARIDERDRDAFFFELARRFFRHFEHVSQSENRDVAPMLHHFGFADLEQFRRGLWHRARAGAARITDRDRAGIVISDRPEHVDEFIFILRLHMHEVRDVPEIADIEKPVMSRAVVAAQPGAIQDRKSTRLNSSHLGISYAVFCLKKKTKRTPATSSQCTRATSE